MRLSPTAGYYIRKLLHQSPTKVTAAIATKRPSFADALSHLDDVLERLYPSERQVSADTLSNLDDVLERLYPSEREISTVVQRLENLVRLHQTLHAQTSLYSGYAQELTKLEQQIFQLFRFQRAEV